MPRLSVGYDMDQFLNHCRMTKPPYECPHASCGRVYRSFTGIYNHMNVFDHENPPSNFGTPKFGVYEPEPLPIPMSTDLNCVEFELDGKLTNISVYDPIPIISKEFYEASLPPHEDPINEVKTPSLKSQGKYLTPKTPKSRSKDKDRGVDVQRYTIEEKKSPKLPEAAFKIIPGYYDRIPDAPKRSELYYRFVEKSIEELDEEVEYDMDEEDRTWLDIMNQKRTKDKLNQVSMESFELLMDRLEKESFFQAQSTGREPGAPIDEDAVCCICMDGECQNSNVILFCDMCNLAVHQECYGVPYIPEGQWLCRRCLQSPSRAVDCALCPNKGGAFKQTDDGRWAHVVCAMWIPEVCFANTVFLEPIDSIGNIPPARWKLTCYICVQRGVGACIQCNKVNCYTAFHVTCAQQAGLHMKIDAIRETSANGTSVTVRKAAYCDMHTPADSDARPQVEELMDSVKKAAAKAASRQKMKKARKILAEKRSAAPIVSVPTLPAERIQQLAKLVDIDKRAIFIHRLLAFWTLKRQSRNGVPLLRRLTTSYARRNMGSNPNKKLPSPSPTKKSPTTLRRRADQSPTSPTTAVKAIAGKEKFREEIKYWQRLRQDLERARLLCELIRKREKTKRELVRAKADERLVHLAPFVHLLLQKIDMLQEIDTQQIFAEPVDFEEVPDYLDVVKHPIDLSTIRQKAQAHQYHNVEQFKSDFELMIDNCLAYNARDTVFYRAGIKLQDQGGAVIRQLSRDVETIGFDPKTGLLLEQRPKQRPEMSDQAILKEIDELVNNDLNEGETYEMRKLRLLDMLDQANLLKNSITRMKRIKLIRKELGVVKRRMWSESLNTSTSDNQNKNEEYHSDKSHLEESDKDDSSVIDDEAEPGVPSRPSSPQPAKETTKLNSLSTLMTAETPKRRLSHKEKSTTPKATGKNLRGSNALKSDKTQRKIDSFFKKTESPQVNKEVKKQEEEKAPPTKNESDKTTDVVSAPAPHTPRKRGRPPKSSSVANVSTAAITESAESLNEEATIDIKSNVENPTKEVTKEPAATSPGPSSPQGNKSPSFNKKSAQLFKKQPGEDLTTPVKNAKGNESLDSLLDLPKETTLTKESFKIYREGGAITQETDDDTQSESNSSLTDSDDESQTDTGSDDEASDSDTSGGKDLASGTGDEIPLEPLDLVWAKCRGYPWYPALIINPKMPRTGYFHNHVPIPVPPDEVLAHASNYETPMYLVLFFDLKRTWQWLPRNKLEPLGVNSALDKAKFVQLKKPTERKAVKTAYEKAILHRCRVTGENADLSGDSEPELQP